jgi:hypothetical protein
LPQYCGGIADLLRHHADLDYTAHRWAVAASIPT